MKCRISRVLVESELDSTVHNFWKDFSVELNYDLYVRLYSVCYLSLCKTDVKEAERFGDELRQHIRTNPYIAHQFQNLRYLCGMNQFLLN